MGPRSDLERATEDHEYVYQPGGEAGINVTDIAGSYAGKDEDGTSKTDILMMWAVKLHQQGMNWRAERNKRANQGTRIHDAFDKWLDDKEAIGLYEHDSGYLDGLERFFHDRDPQKTEKEEIVLSARGYGGRFDAIARLADGRTHLLDLKTGRANAIEHTLQLSAYRFADGIGVYNDWGMLTGLRALPAIDACACLYVQENGTYELVEYPADEAAFGQFLNLLSVYRWTRSAPIRALSERRKVAA